MPRPVAHRPYFQGTLNPVGLYPTGRRHPGARFRAPRPGFVYWSRSALRQPTCDSGMFYGCRLLTCHTSLSELTDTLKPTATQRAGHGHIDRHARARLDQRPVGQPAVRIRWNGDGGRAVYTRGWYPPRGNRTLDGYSLTSPTGTLRPYCICLRLYYDRVGLSEPVVADPWAGYRSAHASPGESRSAYPAYLTVQVLQSTALPDAWWNDWRPPPGIRAEPGLVSASCA